MRDPRSDRTGDVLSALAAGLAADADGLGVKALRVWRDRSPDVVELLERGGEDLARTSSVFMAMLIGSLRSDIELDWRECEQSACAYGWRRAANKVPLESLLEELAVYRRTAIELISAPFQGSDLLEPIVAEMQRRLDDAIDNLNQSVAASYLDRVEADHGAHVRRTKSLPPLATAAGRRAREAAATAAFGLQKTFSALRLRSHLLCVTRKIVRLADKTHRAASSRPAYIEI